MTRSEVDLALARRMVAAARESAASAGALVSVAVVDAGGHLVCFERMDGAEIAGPVLAPDKAYTAVAHRAATHELAPLVEPGGP
ncbi:MAG: GlcG/HbpS family heme-binding protein, partial [Acidimicrobiales bacterium]